MMIILPTNLFVLPILIVIWACDGYLFLCLVRTLRSKSTLAATLSTVTDPLPERLEQGLSKMLGHPVPIWVAWSATLLLLIILRHLLVALTLSILQPPA